MIIRFIRLPVDTVSFIPFLTQPHLSPIAGPANHGRIYWNGILLFETQHLAAVSMDSATTNQILESLSVLIIEI